MSDKPSDVQMAIDYHERTEHRLPDHFADILIGKHNLIPFAITKVPSLFCSRCVSHQSIRNPLLGGNSLECGYSFH